MPTSDVFLSYNRADKDAAQRFADALAAEGLAVWWDSLLQGGSSFAQETEEALESARCVVVLWSASAIKSHWVRDEATRGRERGCLVPVSLDGVQPPLGFRQLQFLDLSDWDGDRDAPRFRALVEAVRRTIANPHGQTAFTSTRAAPFEPAGAAWPTSRRRVLQLGAAAVVVAGGGLAAWRGGLLGGPAQERSIAILPFRNLSGDARQDYFSDGLAEELRATLSRNRQIEVAAETSSNTFRAANTRAQEIASALGVAWLLEGSVRRAGETVRVTAQLIDGGNGFQKWTQSFDRQLKDIFAVQTDIAALVADALAVNIGGEGAGGLERVGGTRNAAALDAYLRGKDAYLHAADERETRAALALLDSALAKDPDFAAAHAFRARVLTYIASAYNAGPAMAGTYTAAIAAAREAVRIAPDLAEGHSALGFALSNGRLDIQGAQAPYNLSFELGSGNAEVLAAFADFAANVGRFAEGRQALARAQRLDPLNANVFRSSALLEFYARDYAATAPLVRTTLSLNAKASVVHAVLGDIALLGGDAAAARRHYEVEPSALSRLRGLAIAALKVGDTAGADAALGKLISEFGDNSFYQQGQVMAQWGRTGDALDRLERALALGDSGLVLARHDPLLDPLRGAPSFNALLTRLGFPSSAAAQ